MKILFMFVTGATMLASALASADVVTAKMSLTTDAAGKAAHSALDACRTDGHTVAVTIVDSAGIVLVTIRDDKAGPHTVSTSRRKAYTALSKRKSTESLVKSVIEIPAAVGLGDIDDFLMLGGGLPIRSGKEIVGAIGVSGAPNGRADVVCGNAGIAAIISADG